MVEHKVVIVMCQKFVIYNIQNDENSEFFALLWLMSLGLMVLCAMPCLICFVLLGLFSQLQLIPGLLNPSK